MCRPKIFPADAIVCKESSQVRRPFFRLRVIRAEDDVGFFSGENVNTPKNATCEYGPRVGGAATHCHDGAWMVSRW